MTKDSFIRDILNPPTLIGSPSVSYWVGLNGPNKVLALVEAARNVVRPFVYVVNNSSDAKNAVKDIKFFDPDIRTYAIPDWETLPYDRFSPHKNIVSERIRILNELATIRRGIVVVTAGTLLHRIAPRYWLTDKSFEIAPGKIYQRKNLVERLQGLGYSERRQVNEYGEMAIRGSIVDIFAIGETNPARIDFFDDLVESIRSFSPEDQRSLDRRQSLTILPAREFPLDSDAIGRFKKNWRLEFGSESVTSTIYGDISSAMPSAGVEYYLPFFFAKMSLINDYLPIGSIFAFDQQIAETIEQLNGRFSDRFRNLREVGERPILKPKDILADLEEFYENLGENRKIFFATSMQDVPQSNESSVLFKTKTSLRPYLRATAKDPLGALANFIKLRKGRILIVVPSVRRKEALTKLLHNHQVYLVSFETWREFLGAGDQLGITCGNLSAEMEIVDPSISVLTEEQLLGYKETSRKKNRTYQKSNKDFEAIVKNLTELEIGDPVVHEDYGVGRYAGLEILETGEVINEYIKVLYADDDKLYIPVRNIDLINRFSSSNSEKAPLHKLGSGQWEKVCKKAAKRIRDVAAEILETYAKREMQSGHKIQSLDDSYDLFSQQFVHEETNDQSRAIDDVISDMGKGKPMDRLICGDVGFGKTEIAMRAAFLAVNAGYQVAVLVPTTLLARQHFGTFSERFTGWPVKIAQLSRLVSTSAVGDIISEVGSGQVDILIGTHKLLSSKVSFRKLGLLVVDEEHRFGVSQKEKIKAIRGDIHILTLTATPIPRTLNFALSGMRDLSLITSPPNNRIAIKTFVSQYSTEVIRESVLRELDRGGQIYFIHNEVKTIDKVAAELARIVPEARIALTHGQLRERDLESRMAGFYQGKTNLLLSTTIVESGIDLPNANTMIINRADKFGLAQLYQLRGRVGRSHHMAYAHLFVPDKKSLTRDANRRLEAIESLDELGMGFLLANHDLEIRGAGEILGGEQSGEIEEMGFFLFNEVLARTVRSLKKEANIQDTDSVHTQRVEIDLHIPALLPDDYLPDVHSRLVLYKRIAGAHDRTELAALREEVIDRYGIFGIEVQNLFDITEVKLDVKRLGVCKADLGAKGGRVEFAAGSPVSPDKLLKLLDSDSSYRMRDAQTLGIAKSLGDATERCEELRYLAITLGAINE